MTAPIKCPNCGAWIMPNIMAYEGIYWKCSCGYNPNLHTSTNKTIIDTPITIGNQTNMNDRKESEGK
jgi:hypothetical protein